MNIAELVTLKDSLDFETQMPLVFALNAVVDRMGRGGFETAEEAALDIVADEAEQYLKGADNKGVFGCAVEACKVLGVAQEACHVAVDKGAQRVLKVEYGEDAQS